MSEYVADGDTYRVRSAVGANEQYVEVMSLEMVAGTAFTAADVAEGSKAALISQTFAEIVFGSAADAVGQTLQPPAGTPGGGPGGMGRRMVMPTFTITGVYADPGELQRASYAVADMVVPYTAMLPSGINVEMARSFMTSTVVMKVQGASHETVEAQVREALAREYGDDLVLEVWEGTPSGETATLQQARSTVSTFALVVNLLGFVLLVTGSIGILSIMLVEVLGRSKEIAVERALGAPRSLITREFFTRSLILAGTAALVGVILSLAFARPLKQLVLPIFSGVTSADIAGSVITPTAIGAGVLAALGVGGVFGVFPVFSALKTNIAEGMREA
jgi:putative ABC transport system permease protein